MKIDEKIVGRFDELIERGNQVLKTRSSRSGGGIVYIGDDAIHPENEYLFEMRTLIQAEVFGDFLEQAKYLSDNGYHAPAAVIAGSVLEDGLRKLCSRKGIVLPAKPKLDSMNAELAKAGAYNVLIQKKITALADLLNKAAHGKWNELSAADVEQMISQVRSFMEDHFS